MEYNRIITERLKYLEEIKEKRLWPRPDGLKEISTIEKKENDNVNVIIRNITHVHVD